MTSPFKIDEILDSPSKLAILRVFATREGLKATGREIAKLAGFSVPSTHESLKDLYERNVFVREIIGKQHIYSLNEEDRIVQKIIRPMFEAENNYKREISDLLLEEIKKAGIKNAIVSLILYGSVEKKNGRFLKGQDAGCKRVLVACFDHPAGTILPVRAVRSSGMTLIAERA